MRCQLSAAGALLTDNSKLAERAAQLLHANATWSSVQ